VLHYIGISLTIRAMLLAAAGGPSASDSFGTFFHTIAPFWWLFVIVAGLGAASLVREIVRARRLSHSGMSDIDAMPGRTFEQYLQTMFQRLGYRVELTQFAADRGGDLVLSKQGTRTVVQAKRWKKRVGAPVLGEVLRARAHYNCTEAMVVTNSSFTPQAIAEARKLGITLWDRKDLASRLASTHARDTAPSSADATDSGFEATPSIEHHGTATVETCAVCSKVLTSAERSYCGNNAARFNGRMFCYRHQRLRAPVR
jgi:restriction system protein